MQLEKKLNNIPTIKNAEVYKTINGELHISVEQRTPIVRIFNLSGESYYIDEEGTLMPLSHKYTSHVLVVSGHINDKYANRYQLNISDIMRNDTLKTISLLDDIFILTQYINSNPFWKAQIEHLYVNKDFEFELIPRVGNHRIVFGDATQLEEKFNKLNVFYKKALNKIGWNEYKIINVKYKNQIVCSKNLYE
jgi:cell division protein FtsQ